MNIKAIQTSYAGYKFRSRLEARWAVYFTEMGASWEYEPEGFVLQDGSCYLPDFFLPLPGAAPGWGYWVEIKAVHPTEKELEKLQMLVSLTGHTAYLLYGVPGANRSTCVHRRCGLIKRREGLEAWSVSDDAMYLPFVHHTREREARLRYPQAVIAAKSARFEHGEKPGRRY